MNYVGGVVVVKQLIYSKVLGMIKLAMIYYIPLIILIVVVIHWLFDLYKTSLIQQIY